MVSKKQIIFYILVFFIFFIIAKASLYLSPILKINQDISLLIGALILTGIIFLLDKFDYTKDDFFFQVTPEKQCDGGPYMYSSNPEKQKLCSKFSKQDLAQYSCPSGFYGRPVHWQRNDMSDSHWNNTMCDGNFKDYSDPKVL
jgi:hypothetical protein